MRKGFLFLLVIFVLIISHFYVTFSMNDDYLFSSVVYHIEDGYITNISPNTDVSLFISYFDLENCQITVMDDNHHEIVDGYVVNGSITVVSCHQYVVASYINIIKGDFTRDGVVDSFDLVGFGKYLIYQGEVPDFLKVSLDIDGVNGVHLNDLMLLDKVISNGYENLIVSYDSIVLQTGESIRVVGSVLPSYGVNGNVLYDSMDSSVVQVDKGGIFIGGKEGSTVVKVSTFDHSITRDIQVVVDNTIQLSQYSGVVYQEGNELRVGIKSISYDDISCSSSDVDKVSCRIDGKYMYLLAGRRSGDAVITVSSSKYGSRTFQVSSVVTGINLAFSDYSCLGVLERGNLTISTFNAGELSFDVSDSSIVRSVSVVGNSFQFSAGNKTGRGEVVIRGSNSSKTKVFTLDVYRLVFPDIGGLAYVGEEIVGNMVAEGVGDLRCVSLNEAIATCRLEDNKLYVQALKKGEVHIKVYNTLEYRGRKYSCGSADFLVVVWER